MDLIAKECQRAYPALKIKPFFSPYGNDELIFDSIQVKIPSISLQKYPFDEYHTSKDEPSHLVEADLQLACEIILHMVEVIEHDDVYKFNVPVPFWMTRFNLFADDMYNPIEFKRNFDIVYRYLDGKSSILKIADLLNVPFKDVHQYVQKMATYNLVTPTGNSPFIKLSYSSDP